MSRPLRPTAPAPYRGVTNPGYLGGRGSEETGYSDLPVNLDGPAHVDLPPARPPKMNPGYVESADAAPPRPPKSGASFRGGNSSGLGSSVILEDDAFDAPPRPPKSGASFRGSDAPPRPPKTGSSFRGGTFA